MSEAMKHELAGIRTYLGEMDKRFERRFELIEGAVNRTAISVTRLTERVDRMESNNATKDDVRELLGRFDTFATEILASRRERALHSMSYMHQEGRIDDHELRITRLEIKRPE